MSLGATTNNNVAPSQNAADQQNKKENEGGDKSILKFDKSEIKEDNNQQDQ